MLKSSAQSTCYKHIVKLLVIINIIIAIIIIMIKIDKIMEMLQDCRYYSIERIKKQTSLPKKKIDIVLRFLKQEALIEEENGKVKITPRGLKLLELPV